MRAHPTLRRLAPVALSIVALSVCVVAGAAGLTSLWLDVPFVAQQKDGCGAASIAMVMQYWEQQQSESAQPDAEPSQILRALYSKSGHGIHASTMQGYFSQNGYRAYAFAGNWPDVEQQLQNGRPLIAALKPDSSSSLHYVVVVGIDSQRQLVLVNDPAQRKLLKEDRSQFNREWKAAGYWTLLAVPAPAVSVPKTEAPVPTPAALPLELVAH